MLRDKYLSHQKHNDFLMAFVIRTIYEPFNWNWTDFLCDSLRLFF